MRCLQVNRMSCTLLLSAGVVIAITGITNRSRCQVAAEEKPSPQRPQASTTSGNPGDPIQSQYSLSFAQDRLVAEHRFTPPLEVEAGGYRIKLLALQHRRKHLSPDSQVGEDILVLVVKPEALQDGLPSILQPWTTKELEDERGRKWAWVFTSVLDKVERVERGGSISPPPGTEAGVMCFGFRMSSADAKQIRQFRASIGYVTEEEELALGPLPVSHLPLTPIVKKDFVLQLEKFGESKTDPASLRNPLHGGIMFPANPGRVVPEGLMEAVLFTLEPARDAVPQGTHWQIHSGELRDDKGNAFTFQRYQQWCYPSPNRVSLGVMFGEVGPNELKEVGIPGGARVLDVFPDSPAERIGLKKGDIIVGVGEETLRAEQGTTQLRDLIQRMQPGEKTTVHFLRDCKRKSVTATLTAANLPAWLSEEKAKATLQQLIAAAGDTRVDRGRLPIYLVQAGPLGDKTSRPTVLSFTFKRHGFKVIPFIFNDIPLPPGIMEAK